MIYVDLKSGSFSLYFATIWGASTISRSDQRYEDFSRWPVHLDSLTGFYINMCDNLHVLERTYLTIGIVVFKIPLGPTMSADI